MLLALVNHGHVGIWVQDNTEEFLIFPKKTEIQNYVKQVAINSKITK